MSWRKSGGITSFDRFNQLRTNTISTDDFTMTNDYQGTFTINGELFVNEDCSFNANVHIGKNVIIQDNLYVKDFIHLGDSSERIIKSTPSGFGINVKDPNAILDICGINHQIMNVHSSSSTVKSTLLRNVHNDTFMMDLSSTYGSMKFDLNGNVFTIDYDTSSQLVSLNKDTSVLGELSVENDLATKGVLTVEKDGVIDGNLTIGENVYINGRSTIGSDLSMGGNLTVGGKFSLNGSLSLEGDISMNGNLKIGGNIVSDNGANIGGDVNVNGNIIATGDLSSNSLFSHGNVVIHDGGLYLNNLLTNDAILRKFIIGTDTMSSGFNITDDAIYLNHNVVIGGDIFIDGSTNLVGNITAQSGSSGGSSVINGVLRDLSGTDQLRMYVNSNEDLSNTELKNAGFYIYNRPESSGASQNQVNEDGFIKVSNISNSRLSFRSIGDTNIVSMDFGNLQNDDTNGLLVLKQETAVINENNDNYRIISSHQDPESINVNNSLYNINDLTVGNIIYCDGDIISTKNFTIKGISAEILNSLNVNIIDDIYIGGNIHFSDETHTTGNLVSLNLLEDLKIGGNIHFSDETHTTGNLVSLNLIEDLKIGGNIHFSDETHTTGNLVSLNLIEDLKIGGNIHFSDETHTTGNLVSLSITENLDISNWLSISNETMFFTRGNLFLNFTSGGIQNVAKKIDDINSSITGSSILPGQNNTFGNDDSAYINTFKQNVSIHKGIHIGDTTLDSGTSQSTYNGIPYILTCIGDISTNGNIITDSIHLRDSLFITNDLSLNGNIFAKNMNIFEDLSINGNVFAHGNVFIDSDLSINNNLYVHASTFLQDVSASDIFIGNLLTIDGSMSCTSHIDNATQSISQYLEIGDDTTTLGENVLVVHGDISQNGILVSNRIFISDKLEVTNDTSINDLYVHGNIQTTTQFNEVMTLGTDSTIGQNIMTVKGDINQNGSLVTDYVFVNNTLNAPNAIINDLQITGNIISQTQYKDLLAIGTDSTIGQTIMTVKGDIDQTGNLVSNSIFASDKLEVTSDTSMNDLYIHGHIQTTTQFNESMTLGTDSTIGETIMTVKGDIDQTGNLVSNSIFASDKLEVTSDTSMNDLYIHGHVQTTTQFNEAVSIGTGATFGNIMNIQGDINHIGTLNSTNAVISENVSINKDLQIMGNIDLNHGSIYGKHDQYSYTIDSSILYNLRDVSQNIQKVLDEFASNSDVRQNANNVFTGNNTFSGDNTFEGDLTATRFNILREVNVIGETEYDRNRDYENDRYSYAKTQSQGSINASHNLYVTGETITQYVFNSNNSFITENSAALSGAELFQKYTIEEISSNALEIIQTLEGGLISCNDINVARSCNLYGETKIYGTLNVPTSGTVIADGETFTAEQFRSALGAVAGTIEITEYQGQTQFGNVVTFDNTAEFNDNIRIRKNIRIDGNIELKDSNDSPITQPILKNLNTISENVQTRLNTLKNQTEYITTTASTNDTNILHKLNVGNDLNVTGDVSINNTLTTHDLIVMNQTNATTYDLTNAIKTNVGTKNIIYVDNDIYMDTSYSVYKNWTCELVTTATSNAINNNIDYVAYFNYDNIDVTFFVYNDKKNYEIHRSSNATSSQFIKYHIDSSINIVNIHKRDDGNPITITDIHLVHIQSNIIDAYFVDNEDLYFLKIKKIDQSTSNHEYFITKQDKTCKNITKHIDSDELVFSTGSIVFTSYNDLSENISSNLTYDNSDNIIAGSDLNKNVFFLTYDSTDSKGVFYNDTIQIIESTSAITHIDVTKNKELLLLSTSTEFKVYKFMYDVSSILLYTTTDNNFIQTQPVFFENLVATVDLSSVTDIKYYKPQYTQYDGSYNYDTNYDIGENIHMTIQDVNGPLPHKDNVVGTLTLKHSQKGGASSIVFPNMSQTSDFATIEYHESDRNIDSLHLQYDQLSEKQNSVLHIGTKQASTHTKDNIVMRTGGSLILDAGKYVTEDISGLFQSSVLPSATTKVENGEVIIQPNGGNVGIGTTDPQHTLDVSGALFVTSIQYRMPFGNLQDNSGNVRIDIVNNGTNTNTKTEHYAATHFFKNLATLGGNTKVDISGDLIVKNNVGIGTTSPSYKLEISGDVSMNNLYMNNLFCNDIRYNGNDFVMAYRDISPTSWAYKYDCGRAIVAGPNNVLFINYDSDFSGGTQIYGNLYINNKVGIGTTSPIAKLDVSGDLHVQNRIYQNGYDFVMAIKDQNPTAIPGSLPDSQWGRALVSNTDVLYINEDADWEGGVNIGGKLNVVAKNIPGQTYDLGQSADASLNLAVFHHNNGNNSYLTILGRRYENGDDWNSASTRIQQKIDITNQAYLEFNPPGNTYGIALGTGNGDNPVERLTIKSNGNVGIGTTSPTEILHVVGNLKVTGTITGSVSGFDSDARSAISVSNSIVTGYGDISYNSTSGTITFTPVTDSDIRGSISAGNSSSVTGYGDISYNSTSGTITFTPVTDSDIRGSISAVNSSSVTGYGSISYNSTSGKITFTPVTDSNIRDRFNGGTGVSISSGTISIGQAVGTSSDVTFNTVEAVSFNATSDYRVKENVQTISGENYTVDNLRPVSYELKDTNKPHIGFIAHELQEHFPTAVNGEKDGETMQTVNYLELIPVLVKEIQDLKKEVKSLKSEISILKS